MIAPRALWALHAAVGLFACRPSPGQARTEALADAQRGGPRAVVEGPSGRSLSVRLEVMRTPEELARGLMFRKSLGQDEGMLFVFAESEDHSFWMKNTLIPLDMIFVDARGTVVGIVERAEPLTTTARTVGAPSRFVVEVNGGWCAAHGVSRGDRVTLEGVEGAR